MENRIQPLWAILSERIYRALLIFYPADFRREYACLMAQAFRDVSRDTYRREGPAGIALWWGSALFDLAISVIEQRRKESFVMSKSLLPAWAGKLLIVGGICAALSAVSQLQPGSPEFYTGVFQISFLFVGPAYLLIALGCFGLPTRYHAQTEPLTRITLYLAAVGALVTALGVSLPKLVAEWLWSVGMLGLILHVIAMVVFGLANITRPILPMVRWLPLLAGLIPFALLLGVMGRGPGSPNWGAFATLLGIGIIWLIMGFFINRERQAEPQPAAA